MQEEQTRADYKQKGRMENDSERKKKKKKTQLTCFIVRLFVKANDTRASR